MSDFRCIKHNELFNKLAVWLNPCSFPALITFVACRATGWRRLAMAMSRPKAGLSPKNPACGCSPTKPAIPSHHALADYADRLLCFAREAAAMASGEDHVVLIGHSLGGTLAALQAARRADGIAALILLEAPLVFDPAVDAFAPWLRTPPAARQLLANAGTVAGSELSMAAVAAAPD